MKPQEILPWIARKAGLGHTFPQKRPLSVTVGETPDAPIEVSESSGDAPPAVLAQCETEARKTASAPILEAEVADTPDLENKPATFDDAPDPLSAPVQLDWLWQHQQRMSQLSLNAFQDTCDFWQHAWQNVYPPGKASDKAP
jgi:hypothetical protein